jgi:hypothetical protein
MTSTVVDVDPAPDADVVDVPVDRVGASVLDVEVVGSGSTLEKSVPVTRMTAPSGSPSSGSRSAPPATNLAR